MLSFCSCLFLSMSQWVTRFNCDPSINASGSIDLQGIKGQHLSLQSALRFSTSEVLGMTI